MSEHKTGKSNWTPEQKERYWQGRKDIASLKPEERRALRRFIKAGGHTASTVEGK